MDICIASDENYAIILKVVMISTIENNRNQNITFHIFQSGMSSEAKKSILAFRNDFINVILYDIDQKMQFIKKRIDNNWANNNSYITYARLYMPMIISDSIDRFIYLDCDTLVMGNLRKLMELDLGDNIIAGVKDVLPYEYKQYKESSDGNYVNAGVLLIDCKKWNECNITQQILEYCISHPSDNYPDQDALNIVLKNRIKILPPKYCVIYPENVWKPNWQIKGYGEESTYYDQQLLMEAKTNPVIIHFVDSVLGRPWQSNNINPYSSNWMKYFNKLDGNQTIKFKKKCINKKQKIFRIMYRVLPASIFHRIYYWRRNKGIHISIEKGMRK